MSANSDPKSRQEALNSGMDYFVAKPFSYEDLKPILRSSQRYPAEEYTEILSGMSMPVIPEALSEKSAVALTEIDSEKSIIIVSS